MRKCLTWNRSSDEWQAVVEVSFTAPECDYWLTTFEDAADLVLPVATSYRARYCATGMDEAHQGGGRMPDDPVNDRYLLQLWPGSPRGDAVVRQTSQVAAYWHEVARTTPGSTRTRGRRSPRGRS